MAEIEGDPEPVAWIRTVEPAAADEALRDLYAGVTDPATGRLDNIMRVHSLHPEGLRAHEAVYRAAMRGTAELRKVDRELIALVVSGINGCHY